MRGLKALYLLAAVVAATGLAIAGLVAAGHAVAGPDMPAVQERDAAAAAGPEKLSPREIADLNEDCYGCHEELDDEDRWLSLDDGTTIDVQVDPAAHGASAHGLALACVSCHGQVYEDDHPEFQAAADLREHRAGRSALCTGCHEDIVALHPQPAQDGSADSGPDTGDHGPGCADCHSAHTDPAAIQTWARLAEHCGTCHEDELADFQAGGHAASIAETEPNADLPRCATCHPVHGEAPTDGLPRALRATALCIDCHSRDLLIRKYELPAHVADSYTQDFHGLTFEHLMSQAPETARPEVMLCSTCHGPHDVGSLDRTRLAQVCGGCHEQANGLFPGAWLGHQPPGPGQSTLVWAVKMAYLVFIPLVIGGLLLHIAFEALLRRRARRARARMGTAGAAGAEHKHEGRAAGYVTRFTRADRLEHLGAMISFSMLVLTGLPQSYPGTPFWSRLIDLWGGIASARSLHRFFGWMFAALMVLHLARNIAGALRRRVRPAMVPTRQDFHDVLGVLRHYLGLGPKPRYGKFDAAEKFEYWGLFLGGTLMAATGFLLIFPETAARILPGIALAAARVAHGYEATLAVLVVVVWHLYGVVFRPEVFPCDTTMFTGRMSVERLKEEHPREYERLFPGAPEAPAPTPGPGPVRLP